MNPLTPATESPIPRAYPEPGDVQLVVTDQGAVKVSHATIFRRAPDIVCIHVSCESKYARPGPACYGGEDDAPPELALVADEMALYLDESQPRDKPTVIEFPEYPGWKVFAVDGCVRYVVNVVLARPRED